VSVVILDNHVSYQVVQPDDESISIYLLCPCLQCSWAC